MSQELTLRDALQLAIRQNEHDMLLTGDELRACRAALARTQQPERADNLCFHLSTMLDCPPSDADVVAAVESLLPQQPEQAVPEDVRRDAERYNKLVACGAYAASVFKSASTPWGLASGLTRGSSKAELDAAIDALASSGAKGE